MSSKNQRQSRLIELMQTKGILPVKALSATLGVSEMTIRRDLRELECTADETSLATTEYSLLQAVQHANNQKDRIGKFAASLIEPNDVISIDTGSTTAKMLPYIPSDKNLTVLCYNANVLTELLHKQGLQLLFGGGVYHENTEMFESPEAIAFIQKIRINKVFLSAAGVEKTLGITCANAHEVASKTAVIESSLQRILLADSGKFDQVRSSYFCDLSDIHIIISDSDLSEDWKQFIRSKGIALYLV